MSERAARFGGVGEASERRTLAVACGAHALHDGFTDLLYVLLPLWQAEFGLGYAEVGMLRALYAGAMASFQLPAGMLADRLGGPRLLALGTLLAGLGYAVAGLGGSLAALMAALAVGGLGSSVQHPIGANLVARAFSGKRSRIALARYNFAGDLGKMTLPAATAWMVAMMPWRRASFLLAALGLVAAGLIVTLCRTPEQSHAPAAKGDEKEAGAASGRGFPLLLAIGVIDSATRMGFLTFLPFLLRMKGAPLPLVGTALTLVFAGGAAGKLVCGSLGARFGVIPAVFLTEGMTAAGIFGLLPLPLGAALALLPMIGIALNGTSSVLYGTVPELVRPERRQQAFSLFYTGAIGSGALSPVLYGLFSDAVGVPRMMALIAGIVLLTLPLAWALRPALPSDA
ncbi:MAG TPA: MFS transporter [Stellaceae bacterium]|nr:MFS transporter [Stellaceae bacterium]